MIDFHHNIFYYYRGALQKEMERDRQLEDNVTKALINTLGHSNGKIRKKFLDWLGISISANDPVHLELQRATIGEERIARKEKRILLALLPDRGDFRPTGKVCENLKGDSRPDAWIYGENFAILVESKVVGYVDPKQMNCHFEKLRREDDPEPIYLERRWADIHALFNRMGYSLSGQDSWLVSQFTQFLEFNNMADFAGFTEEFFDYFFAQDDEDIRKWVRASFGEFAEKVHDDLVSFSPFYATADVGMLKQADDHVWAAFGPKTDKNPKEYRQWAHQTIAADSQEIRVFANIELKSAVDRLKEKIQSEPEKFRKLLARPHESSPFQVTIEERIQRQVQQYDYHPVAVFESAYLTDSRTGEKAFEFMESLLLELPLPYFKVVRRIKRVKAIELSKKQEGKGLIQEIVSIMKDFHPLIEFVNG